MSDHKNFWIGILSLSAVVLFSTLLLVDRPARAEGAVLDKGGDYTMCTGMISSGVDAVYIIDAQMGKLISYRLAPGANKLVISAPIDLKKANTPAPSVGR